MVQYDKNQFDDIQRIDRAYKESERKIVEQATEVKKGNKDNGKVHKI